MKKNIKYEEEQIKFSYPEGKKVIDEKIILPNFGDTIKITIYESSKPLDSPQNNHYALAGILIKTKGAILDNQLFKYDSDPYALYFFGEAICEGLEDRIRKGETEIIDFNRGGLSWRHNYCKTLSKTIEKVLEPLVVKKKKEVEKEPEKEVKESTKKMVRKLCSLINNIAKQELEDIPDIPTDTEYDITSFIIKPEKANISIDKPRIFSVYSPNNIVKYEGQEVKIESTNNFIHPLSTKLKLEKHPNKENVWYKYFKVVGEIEGEKGDIIAKLGEEIAKATIEVATPKKRKIGKIYSRKGGFLKDINTDNLLSPTQRVYYEGKEGIIKIFINFPSVSKFFKGGLDEGVETAEGRLLLAELVGEAFCKEVARKGIYSGKYQSVPDGEIDSYITAFSELQKKYLHKIQDIILTWDFKK
ncbi:hypothetical protein ACFL4Z_02415 [candidate division KSB1 bacterium]